MNKIRSGVFEFTKDMGVVKWGIISWLAKGRGNLSPGLRLGWRGCESWPPSPLVIARGDEREERETFEDQQR